MDYKISYFDEVSSTMQTIKSADKPAIHIAHAQTKGMGQYGRTWLSPPGKGLYFSLKNDVVLSNQDYVLGMAQLAALTVAKLLNDMTLDVKLKWPNDLYYANKKLGGVLVELEGVDKQTHNYILGVGINFEAPVAVEHATGLEAITKNVIDKKTLIAQFVNYWDKHLAIFAKSGLKTFTGLWQSYDYLLKKNTTLVYNNETFTGQSRGIDDFGCLKLCLDNGASLSFNHQASIIDINSPTNGE